MSVRRLIVEIAAEDVNVTRFCAQHGVSTWFFYDLRRRYAAGGLEAIEPRSRAPKRVWNRTSDEVEDRIVELRKQLIDAGLDAGAATIAYHLGEGAPSEATIWRVLTRRGFITPDPTKAPRRPVRRFVADRANERWQCDDTGWELADGTAVKIINIIDDATRVIVASRAAPTATADAIFAAFSYAMGRWGCPERVLWDNAKAHQSLTDTLASIGVEVGHSRFYHPQTCGKVERFHQTLKRYLSKQPRCVTLHQLQAQLDRFAAIYNHQRPHRALDRRIPADVWATTPRSGPANRPLNAPTRTYHVTVAANGVITLGHRYQIILGRRYAGASATAITTGRACHIFINTKLVRALTLDPTRRVQPLHRHQPLP